MPIMRRERRKRQRPLIIIADISGSMEKYADLFLVFAHAAQRRIDSVEVFTFSTELTRITEDLRRRDTKSALSRVSGRRRRPSCAPPSSTRARENRAADCS